MASSEVGPSDGGAGAGPARFIDKLLTSNGSEHAQVFTLAAPPFKIVHVNPAWCLLCGWQSAEAIGLTCNILQGPETSPDALRELHGAIDARRPITVRLVNYTKTHEPFLNELSLMPLLDDAHCVTHFLGTLRRLDSAHAQRKSAASSATVAEMAVAAAWNAAQGPLAHGTASPEWNAIGAALGSGQRRLREVDEGSSAQSASDAPCSDILLSREAFPLDTLNNHPVAPVLLRMLQLNSSAGLQVPPGGNKAVDEAGGVGEKSSSSLASLELESSRSARLYDALPHPPAHAPSAANACAPPASGGELSSLLARGRVTQGLVQGGETPLSSQSSQFLEMAQPSAASSKDQQAFLAAVVRQGVIPPASWPLKPHSSSSPPLPCKQSDLCGESSDPEPSYGYGSDSGLRASFLYGAEHVDDGAVAASSGSAHAASASPTMMLSASSTAANTSQHEGAMMLQGSSSSQVAKGGRKRACDARQYGPGSKQGGGGGDDGDGGSNGRDGMLASGVSGSSSSCGEASCGACSAQRRGGSGRKGKGGSSCGSAPGGLSSDEAGQPHSATKPSGPRRRRAKEELVHASEMHAALLGVRGLVSDGGGPLLEAMLRCSPSLAELPEMQELQQRANLSTDTDGSTQRIDADLSIGQADVGKARDAFTENETESYLQLDDVLQVLDSWDEFEHFPSPADLRGPPPAIRAKLKRTASSGQDLGRTSPGRHEDASASWSSSGEQQASHSAAGGER